MEKGILIAWANRSYLSLGDDPVFANMKIAYVYDAVFPWVKGGAEKRVYELSRRLAGRGHEVHCYGIKWWEGDQNLFREDVHYHGICPPMELYVGGRRSIREAVAFAWRVLAHLSGGYDIVDCQHFPYFPCFSARMRTWRRPATLFITWHEVWGSYWRDYLGRKKGIFGQAIECGVASLTTNNIAVSERTKRDLEGLGKRGIKVVSNGIDLHEIEMISPSEQRADLVYAGRLLSHKNVDLLISAIDLKRDEIPDVRALIIGEGPEAERLKQQVRELELEERVELTGFLEYKDMIARIKASRLFVFPSTREGFGMAALEALACGTPVVTVDHPMNATADLVRGAGFICPPTARGLAGAIIDGLEKSERLRKKCLERARGYDWETVCNLAERAYDETG
jgi:glycosyltransferase involved in cell wall biosynthesis